MWKGLVCAHKNNNTNNNNQRGGAEAAAPPWGEERARRVGAEALDGSVYSSFQRLAPYLDGSLCWRVNSSLRFRAAGRTQYVVWKISDLFPQARSRAGAKRSRSSAHGPPAREGSAARTIHRWNRNPRPQLEPQIPSFERCNIITKLHQKHQFTSCFELGSGGPIPSVMRDRRVDRLQVVDELGLGHDLYVYIYIYTHTRAHVYVCVCIYIYIYMCMHTCIHIYIYICIYVYTHTCIYIYIYTQTYIYIYVYIYIYIYIYDELGLGQDLPRSRFVRCQFQVSVKLNYYVCC